ncbi:MAG: amino acid permease [Candidatus Marsarchaeota archaeon]|nr:amino acid permease [Candidatus Marsarchaeota archaeon]
MKLKRSLNLLDSTLFELGGIIGAGIFVIIGFTAARAGTGLLFSILITGITSILTALTYAELSSGIPEEGGEYAFSKKVSNKLGFIVGTGWIIADILAAATVMLGFSAYFNLIQPIPFISLIALLFLALISISGVKKSALLNNIITSLKILALLLFVFYAFTSKPIEQPAQTVNSIGILAGAGLMFFAFSGFGKISELSEEVKNPEKTIPKAVVLGVAAVVIIYLLIAQASLRLATPLQLSATLTPLATAIQNKTISSIIILGALLATLSVALTLINGASRILYSMSKKIKALSKLNNSGVPSNAILLISTVIAVLSFAVKLNTIIRLASMVLILFYATLNLALIYLKEKNKIKPKYSFFYPYAQIIAFIMLVILFFSLTLPIS